MSQNLQKGHSFYLRPLCERDLDGIYAIEKAVYEDPWTQNLLLDSLKAPLTYHLGAFGEGETCLGYGIFQVVYSEGHLLNLAVDPQAQGQGIGTYLLERILEAAKAKGALSFFLEVRPSNLRAKKLYEKKGFRPLLVREKYYPNGEAALIMVTDILLKKES